MATMEEIRARFPQYEDMSDGDLLMGLHRKFYADMHPRAFLNSIEGAANAHVTIERDDLKQYWRENVSKPMEGEAEEDVARRLTQAGTAPVATGGRIGAAARSGLQGMTLGAGDEIVARGASLLGGEPYEYELERERRRLGQGREDYPATALASEIGGAVALPLGAAATAGSLPARAAKGALTGGALGGTYGFMTGEGGAENRVENARDVGLLSAALGGAFPLAAEAGRRIARTATARRMASAFTETAPSVDDLTAEAGKLYDAARANGVTASPQQTQNLAGKVASIARAEGVITPSGKVNETFPAIRHALNMVDDYAQGTMSPTQMQTVRRVFQDAAKSVDGNERRIGYAMLRAFDDWVAPLAPEFKEANALYRKAMGGEMIETAIELAGARAGQFSGSGFENALRTEFRALDRQIVKGKIPGLNEAQIEAIKKVARGGPVENLFRDIGKAAPRGIVSAGVGGGVPFAIGNAIGGPLAGIAAGAGTLAAGEAGRRTATAMQTKNAALASALMRTGGQMPTLPPAYGSAATDAVVSGLLGADPVIADRLLGLAPR